jgi:hypothetical protein
MWTETGCFTAEVAEAAEIDTLAVSFQTRGESVPVISVNGSWVLCVLCGSIAAFGLNGGRR